ncbi:hypothetical protein EYB31_20790 [Paenibacillus thalictri]|uniref:Uncharacterized protein n=1 Tax=Paenibacillus thalictri TaxID=2527873 RepID=A0A4Q9DLI4_9BACL|nr:hypothetical protein EYB31_20790 [Paenibacillus thalictri]
MGEDTPITLLWQNKKPPIGSLWYNMVDKYGGYVRGAASYKEVIVSDMLGTLYLFVKVVATLLSLWFSLRKLHRWIRKRAKRKPPFKG